MAKLGTPGATVPVPQKYAKFRVETKIVRSSAWDPELQVSVHNPAEVYDVSRKIEGSDRERLLALYLNANNDLIGVQELAIGDRGASPVPRDVILRTGLLTNAAGMILVHNHPSGHVEFSENDKKVANNVQQAAELMQMQLLDFMVIGNGQWNSLRDKGGL